MGGQGRRSAARQREKAAGAEKVAEKPKPKSYKSALALFCSSALLADANKKATKAPLASAVKKRPKTTPLASAVLDDARKRPKAPLAGAVFDSTKFTPAQKRCSAVSCSYRDTKTESPRPRITRSSWTRESLLCACACRVGARSGVRSSSRL